jgi:DNA invertase Pin-like site-specific DNA recombinase
MVQEGYDIKGWNVNHKCHNRCCVNPAHLYLGSQKSNIADCIRAGRFKSNKGEDNPRAKLNQLTAYNIRSDYSSGMYSYSKLASKYGVGKSTIARVIKGEAWLGN